MNFANKAMKELLIPNFSGSLSSKVISGSKDNIVFECKKEFGSFQM